MFGGRNWEGEGGIMTSGLFVIHSKILPQQNTQNKSNLLGYASMLSSPNYVVLMALCLWDLILSCHRKHSGTLFIGINYYYENVLSFLCGLRPYL